MDEEQTVWEGHSSNVINLTAYLLCALVAGALIGGAIILRNRMESPYVYALAGCRAHPAIHRPGQMASEQIPALSGDHRALAHQPRRAFRKTDEMELYRVKDYVLI